MEGIPEKNSKIPTRCSKTQRYFRHLRYLLTNGLLPFRVAAGKLEHPGGPRGRLGQALVGHERRVGGPGEGHAHGDTRNGDRNFEDTPEDSKSLASGIFVISMYGLMLKHLYRYKEHTIQKCQPRRVYGLSYDVNSQLQLLYNKGVEKTGRNHVRLLRYIPYLFLNT